MKKFLRNYWLLILIIFLAAFLRLYRLGSNPPSLHWDETAIGYNAYSILKTGRDEYGKFLPLIFKSFGDYKPGLYVYLTVPSIALFGLNEFAVRLPSALIGIATVWLLYRVVCQLLPKQKPPISNSPLRGISSKCKYPISLLASFSLAVSPWHLQFSRGAWEANVALFFTLLGIWGFLGVKGDKIWKLYFSALSFGASVLTYQGGKMIVPLVVLGLIICFWGKLKNLPKRYLFTSALLLLLISLPILVASVTGGGGRLKVMSVFSYRRPMEEINQIFLQDNNNQLYFNLFHSESLAFARGILGRYFNHFSGKFLFFEGDWSSARHSVPYAGVLYYIDLIFLLAGVVSLIKLKLLGKNFVWWWLLVSPLPAALSRDAIQSVRAINMVLPLMIIIGCGMYQVYLWLKSQKKIIFIVGCLSFVVFYFWNFAYYLDQYYVHYPYQSSKYWQYGYKNVVNKIYPIKNGYEKIVFTQKWGQPYIYWLFYTKYSPVDYQKQARLTENPYGDVGQVERLDNIEFRNIYWPLDRGLEKTLFIGDQYELPLQDIDPNQARILDEIKFLNGEVAFRVVETL